MITITLLVMILFAIKHFVADFLLQNEYMLGKFKEGMASFFPLLAHSAVHGAFTLAIGVALIDNLPLVFSLAVFDLVSHFIMDRIKASPVFLGRYVAMSKSEMIKALQDRKAECPVVRQSALDKIRSNKLFWWSLGFDQLWHNITDIVVGGTIVLQMFYGS